MSTAHNHCHESTAYLAVFPGIQPRNLMRGNQGPMLPATLKVNSPSHQCSQGWIKRLPWLRLFTSLPLRLEMTVKEEKIQIAKKDRVLGYSKNMAFWCWQRNTERNTREEYRDPPPTLEPQTIFTPLTGRWGEEKQKESKPVPENCLGAPSGCQEDKDAAHRDDRYPLPHQTFPKIMSRYTTVYTNHWVHVVRYLNIISSYTNSYMATDS